MGRKLEDFHDSVRAEGTLPAASMALLRMRFFEDLSPREMAARLGCSEQAVHKRLQRLLEHLRQKYDVDE